MTNFKNGPTVTRDLSINLTVKKPEGTRVDGQCVIQTIIMFIFSKNHALVYLSARYIAYWTMGIKYI